MQVAQGRPPHCGRKAFRCILLAYLRVFKQCITTQQPRRTSEDAGPLRTRPGPQARPRAPPSGDRRGRLFLDAGNAHAPLLGAKSESERFGQRGPDAEVSAWAPGACGERGQAGAGRGGARALQGARSHGCGLEWPTRGRRRRAGRGEQAARRESSGENRELGRTGRGVATCSQPPSASQSPAPPALTPPALTPPLRTGLRPH